MTTTKGDVELRRTIERLNLEIGCGFVALESKMEATEDQATKDLAANEANVASKLSECQKLSEDARDSCELYAELGGIDAERGIELRSAPTELPEFKMVCNSLEKLLALADKYPDAFKPDALVELLTLDGDMGACRS